MGTKYNSTRSRYTGPWVYFALVFALSWSFTIPAALSGANLTESPLLMIIYALGGLGPAVAAILLTYLSRDPAGWRDYWRRIVDVKRIPLRWYGVIFLLVPAITATAALMDWLLGGQGLQLELAARLLQQPWLILPLVFFYLIFGPLPEEMGWRGYALDRLQARWSALTASLILGVAWALWHLPIFFVKGTYQESLGFGSRSFWIFMFSIMATSILYTWIYNNTRRSTLSAILFHFVVNFTGELFAQTPRAEALSFALTILVALLVVAAWGSKRLAYKEESFSLASIARE
ncbi:MAG: type II CAAX endopeptidase family protein [Anaerolineales bacterium]|jgi:membrane protease YdiL (CAAX protease family)